MKKAISITITPELRRFAKQGFEKLTSREREILENIANCYSAKETARIRGISPRTVEVHKANIRIKLGARNSADMMRIIYALVFSPAPANDTADQYSFENVGYYNLNRPILFPLIFSSKIQTKCTKCPDRPTEFSPSSNSLGKVK